MRDLVGGTGVAVGGTEVAVGGTEVAVGGTEVAVGGTEVAVGGTEVEVGGTVVACSILALVISLLEGLSLIDSFSIIETSSDFVSSSCKLLKFEDMVSSIDEQDNKDTKKIANNNFVLIIFNMLILFTSCRITYPLHFFYLICWGT